MHAVVHPSAVVADGAQLADDVSVGPYCVVGPQVRLGARTVLQAHVVIEGDTALGEGNSVFPFACLGTKPQDKKLTGKDKLGQLRIGDGNEIRENVTIHGGTPHGTGLTRVGDHNMILAGAHIGHDATLGSRVVLTNGAMIAGHTLVEDRAILGAMVGLHQFARVGQGAMVGAGAMVSRDVPPFALAQGDRARLVGVNSIGLKRSGASTEQIARVKRFFRALFWRSGTLAERVAHMRPQAEDDPLMRAVLEFVAESRRGVIMPRVRTEQSDQTELADA